MAQEEPTSPSLGLTALRLPSLRSGAPPGGLPERNPYSKREPIYNIKPSNQPQGGPLNRFK